MKNEFSEVLRDLVLSHFPDKEKEKVDALIEDILSHVGRIDYRYLHESLCWEHMECLEKLKKSQPNNLN